jgi:serine/threonine protein kinase/class 3 adenylate cyclase
MDKNALRPGFTIGGFRIVSQIGSGGMGTVYRAVQPRLDAPVALKVIRSGQDGYKDAVARFGREARQIAQLRGRSQHVVQIYDFGSDDVAGLYFIAMELVEGEGIDRILSRRGKLDEQQAARIVRQAARGLAVAHGLGIVHRDLKPENLLLGRDGVVKVSDFGLAKELGKGSAMTAAGTLLGTPSYMSPEQAIGKTADKRSDIYSLGATLYTLLTGKTPFSADNAMAMALQHVAAPTPDPAAAGAVISPELNAVVGRMMAKSADDRYQSADEVVHAIDALLGTGPTGADAPDVEFLVPLLALRSASPDGADAPAKPPSQNQMVTVDLDAAPPPLHTTVSRRNPQVRTNYGPVTTTPSPRPIRQSTASGGRSSRLRIAAYVASWAMVGLITVTITAVCVWRVGRAQQLERIRNELVSYVAAAAELVDGDRLDGIRKADQEDGPEFNAIRDQMRAAKKLNAKALYIYTVRPTGTPGMVEFVVDEQDSEDENGNGMIDPDEERAHVGEKYNAALLAPSMIEGREGPIADAEATGDKWGRTISGYAPIRNRAGKPVAILGVDYDASVLDEVLDTVYRAFGIAAAVATLLAALIGILVARRTVVPWRAERDRYREALARFVSPSLAEEAAKDVSGATSSSATRRRVTVLVLQVQRLTAAAEEASPDGMVDIINKVLERLSEIVDTAGGSVNRFLGDGLMALFGASGELAEQEIAATGAALEMADAVEALCAELGLRRLNVTAGIHVGLAFVGSIGSKHRTEYTSIGSTVNLAHGLEAACGGLNARILASAATMEAAKQRFMATRFDGVQIPGIADPMTVYAVESIRQQP